MPVFSSKNEAIRWINAAASAQETIDELNNNSAAKRTQVALARMAQQGKRVGEIPYGFKLAEDGVHLVEDATEQRLVQTIRDLKAKGLTWAQVAEEMNSRGFVTKKGRPWSWRTAQAVVV
jgi:DNA invertase Pin-like site-specific DNA recombinase